MVNKHAELCRRILYHTLSQGVRMCDGAIGVGARASGAEAHDRSSPAHGRLSRGITLEAVPPPKTDAEDDYGKYDAAHGRALYEKEHVNTVMMKMQGYA